MSLFSALNSATAGLRTVQANVQLVSDNVARANDPTRTRHTVQQVVDRSGAVITTDYRREVDSALRSQVEDLTARSGGTAVKNTYMVQLGDLLGSTNGTPLLNTYAEDFASAMKLVETSPEDEAAKYQLLQAADTFSREIRRVSEGVEDIDRGMKSDMDNSLKDANDLLKQIGQINNDIVSLGNKGDSANQAADKRDALIQKLAEYIPLRRVERPDGRVALFTPTGLSLIDAEPANLSFDGGKINLTVGKSQYDISQHLQDGKLGALYNMRKDGSLTDPPTAASADPTSEVIRKLRSQLDAYAQMFTSPTKPGEPTSFADAYDNARPLQDGEQDTRFFVGTDRFTLEINPKLMSGEAAIKQSAIPGVVTAMNSVGRSLTADGLTVTDASYSGIASAITGQWMTTSKTVADQNTANADAKNQLDDRYRSQTGVSIDEEIAQLQQLQTSYAASARVMQVTNSMFDALERIVG